MPRDKLGPIFVQKVNYRHTFVRELEPKLLPDDETEDFDLKDEGMLYAPGPVFMPQAGEASEACLPLIVYFGDLVVEPR